MPKLKSRKALIKKVKITKNKKITKRKAGQSHFNAKESGKTKKNKRRDVSVSKGRSKNMKQLMPY